ncbi:MAG: gamma-mobile-trio integrase GmtZ [Burkholderiaceae bacterium]
MTKNERRLQSPWAESAVPGPDLALEELLNGVGKINSPAMAMRTSERLKILDQICREQYEKGSSDFSRATIGQIFEARGGPMTRKDFRLPYSPLIEVWAKFAGGYTVNSNTLSLQKKRQTIVDYIDAHFRQHSRLPPSLLIRSGVKSAFEGNALSTQLKLIQNCVRRWGHIQLERLPIQVVAACNDLFDQKLVMPNARSVQTLTKETCGPLSLNQIDNAIEHWRQWRFAIELWEYAPTNDRSGLRWLELHPKLREWRPMVLDYLASLATDCLRRTASLALHRFFAGYLLELNLPLTPKLFLSKRFNAAPCLVESAMKDLSGPARHWRMVNELLERVLIRGNGFFKLDGHGHRIALAGYCNPLPKFKCTTGTIKKNRRVPLGALKDPELLFITELNPNLEQWRIYSVSFLSSAATNRQRAVSTVRQFIVDYIVGQRLPTDPSVLLSLNWQRENTPPPYVKFALKALSGNQVVQCFNKAVEFMDYVLETYYSAEDDYSRRTVSGDYRNPLLSQTEDTPTGTVRRNKSDKEVLPSRYIRYLRELICPDGSAHFRDLKWAQNAVPFGDWFEVDPCVIDKEDPNCVHRVREVFGQDVRKGKRTSKFMHEIWSPVRTIALLIKLELPLRTFQVRMLESGEADTWRYEGGNTDKNVRGKWIYRAGDFSKNTGPLVANIGKTERHAGVFRRMPDPASGKIFAGLYINTNKTQDRGKDQWDRGYVIPWQHRKILYWCEQLRNWQEKYNPVRVLSRCTDLPEKIIGDKSNIQKNQMGSMGFLFRDPAADEGETAWPIADGHLDYLWRKALATLQDICAERGHSAVDGSRLQFVPDVQGVRTLYPLHSLRVSLITHLATEGGVEMHILSECIAGHARILMTLYYKKSGVAYVSEAMEAASDRIKEEMVEQQNWIRWIQEASLKQLEVNSAAVDLSVLQVVKDALCRGGVSLLRTNLGLCAKGGMGCGNGALIVDEDTGTISYGPVAGYPQQKNCVRCRWFLTGPAFLQALTHHWNLLHFDLGDAGHRYLAMSEEIVALESLLLDCQRLNVPFENEAHLENLRHQLTVIYDGNEKLAADSLATMRLIVRCKFIVDSAKNYETGVALIAVGGMQDVEITVRECSELEQLLTTAVGSTIYVDEDARKAVLRAGNAFDRMLAMNGRDPVFFKLSEVELPVVVSHMTRLLQTYAGSIGRAVSFVEGIEKLSALGLFGNTDELLRVASAGTPLHLIGGDERGPILAGNACKVTPLNLENGTVIKGE